MSKTKEMLEDTRGNQPIDHNKHLDDEYHYEQWRKQQETKQRFGDPPLVSDCCDAPISKINPDNKHSYLICTNCKNLCIAKNEE